MRKPTKTYPRIRWADGTMSHVVKRGRMWYFHVPATDGDCGGEHGTDSMWGVKDAAEAYGGELVRIPNPYYEKQRQEYEAHQLARKLAPFFRF